MRNHFENEMERLQMDILKMSSMVEESLLLSVTALKNKDVVSAQKVIDGDEAIDDKEITIEDHCLKLIALQQPLAKDLRIIATALKIITDLERIADYSSDISKITLKVASSPASAAASEALGLELLQAATAANVTTTILATEGSNFIAYPCLSLVIVRRSS